MVIDNLDDILSQRSQASQCNGSEANMSLNDLSIKRKVSGVPTLLRLGSSHSRTSSHPRVATTLSSEDEVDDLGGHVGLVNPHRIVRRHSAIGVGSERRLADSLVAESDKSSSDSPVSEPAEDRLISSMRRRKSSTKNRKSWAPTSSQPSHLIDEDSEVESPQRRERSTFLRCLVCFKQNSQTAPSSSSAPPLTQSARSTDDHVFQDPACMLMNRIFLELSENVEVDVLNPIDQRAVFLLFSALSGEPLLIPSEYHECDEWIDWLTLGFSSSELDAFERDINRTGSQSLGMLFQAFFALEFTEAARLSSLIIRNVHFDPSALFGLFAVNCAKWTREVVRTSMVKFDQTSASANTAKEGPLIFTSVRPMATKRDERFSKFNTLLDWWVSGGLWTDLAEVEKPFGDHFGSVNSGRNSYASFRDEYGQPEFSSDDDGVNPPEIAKPRRKKVSERRPINSPIHNSRVSSVNVNIREDMVLLRQALILGGVYYSYCVIAFTKFWLQKDLISVDTDVARDRLTNAYLEDSFVRHLKLSPSAPISSLLKDVDHVKARVEQLWKSSGWTPEDLLGEADSPLNGSRLISD